MSDIGMGRVRAVELPFYVTNFIHRCTTFLVNYGVVKCFVDTNQLPDCEMTKFIKISNV